MSHAIWFHAPLTCLNCGSHIDGRDTRLNTSGLNPDPIDRSVRIGDAPELHLDDFEDGYLTLRQPGDDPEIRVLEEWGCPVCRRAQWARLDFHRESLERYRFVSARSVPLTPEVLLDIHFISRRLDLWAEANPGEVRDRILPLVSHVLPRPKDPTS